MCGAEATAARLRRINRAGRPTSGKATRAAGRTAGPRSPCAHRARLEGSPHICNSAKRSQFFGVLYDVDWLEGQQVSSLSAPICHMASFCRNWVRLMGSAAVLLARDRSKLARRDGAGCGGQGVRSFFRGRCHPHPFRGVGKRQLKYLSDSLIMRHFTTVPG
jgi:hypothetical protein